MEKDSELERTKARRLFLLALLFCFLYLVFTATLIYLYELEYSEVLAEK